MALTLSFYATRIDQYSRRTNRETGRRDKNWIFPSSCEVLRVRTVQHVIFEMSLHQSWTKTEFMPPRPGRRRPGAGNPAVWAQQAAQRRAAEKAEGPCQGQRLLRRWPGGDELQARQAPEVEVLGEQMEKTSGLEEGGGTGGAWTAKRATASATWPGIAPSPRPS